MKTSNFTTAVRGMTCRPCEDTILDALLAARGVLRAEVSYWRATVKVIYDPELISEAMLRELLTRIGYAPCESAHGGFAVEFVTAAAALATAVLLPYLPLPAIPQAQAGASVLFLLLTGLVTGTHCICMCGGILLSQTTGGELQGKKRPALAAFWKYQAGRLLTCVMLGTVFGAAGRVLSYSLSLKSMVYTLCGLAVLFIGLCMWGVFPALRRIQAQLPAACRLPKHFRSFAIGKPLLVGVLNGFLPCAASGAMWLYAASSGNALRGAVSMLVWCLGTIPAMGIFSLAGHFLPPRGLRVFERVSVVLMLAMGLHMAVRGIAIMIR